jgi:hypothetical protein
MSRRSSPTTNAHDAGLALTAPVLIKLILWITGIAGKNNVDTGAMQDNLNLINM